MTSLTWTNKDEGSRARCKWGWGVRYVRSDWGGVPPALASEQIRTTFLSFRCTTVHIRAGQDELGSVRIAPNYAPEYTLDESE